MFKPSRRIPEQFADQRTVLPLRSLDLHGGRGYPVRSVMHSRLANGAMLTGAMLLFAQPALAQSAWVGPCELADSYMRGANFQAAYRGVHRETVSTDPCGRDVVTVYNLRLRASGQAVYDVTGRQYYVWPTRGACDVHAAGPFVRGVVRLTQQRQANGENCRVVLTASFDLSTWQVGQQDGQSIVFSAPITPIGVGAQQFAVSREGETEAMIFYAAVTIPHATTVR